MKRKKTLKKFILEYGKKAPQSCPEWDFCNDAFLDKKFPNVKNWKELKTYLENQNACLGAIEAAENVFKKWQKQYGPIDGMSPKDVERLRKATRQVWSWSTPRKLCIQRATGEDGFVHCEKCKIKTPRVHVDHKIAVGKLDEGYFKRLYVSSKGLQALCKKCHGVKTAKERSSAKDFF